MHASANPGQSRCHVSVKNHMCTLEPVLPIVTHHNEYIECLSEGLEDDGEM